MFLGAVAAGGSRNASRGQIAPAYVKYNSNEIVISVVSSSVQFHINNSNNTK